VSITEELPNDFPALFAKYPHITHVFFKGSKAEAAFRRHALPACRQTVTSSRALHRPAPPMP